MPHSDSRAPAPAAYTVDLNDPQARLRFALSVGMSDIQAGALLRPTAEERAAALAQIDVELERRGVIRSDI